MISYIDKEFNKLYKKSHWKLKDKNLIFTIDLYNYDYIKKIFNNIFKQKKEQILSFLETKLKVPKNGTLDIDITPYNIIWSPPQ